MNISEHLIVSARLFPDQAAIVFEGDRFTYQQIDELSRRAASRLQHCGVERGQRIGILLSNVPSFVIWYYATLRVGAVAVSISTRLAPEESAFILSDSGSVVLVTDQATLDSIKGHLPDCILETCCVDDLGQQCNGKPLANQPESVTTEPVYTEPDDPALILYTSGTTGFAKGATLSHRNVRATVHAFNHLCQMRSDDRILLAVPLFHCYGQNALLNSGFNMGATIVLQRRFDLEESKRLIIQERVNRLFGVPTTFQLLEEYCEPTDLQSVEYCFSAAATLPIQLSRRWQEKFTMPIFEGYGLTETAPFASYNHRLKFVPGSIGTPVDLCEMKIVDTETGETCPPGELGEIAIRGPNVMLGYWNRPEDTAHAIRDGWFHSGDIGRMDDNGYFFIVDRVKDMISVGGLKVYPAEVERVMLDHPAVSESAVVGKPDDVFGEKVVAFVVATEMPDPQMEDSLAEYCQVHLADFKVPRETRFVDELPRNPAGKVLKTRLRETGPAREKVVAAQVARAAAETAVDRNVESPIPAITDNQGPWIGKLAATHPAGRRRLLTRMIQEQVHEIIGHGDLPEPEDRFIEVGLDSLMIVDLRDRLQSSIGPRPELPATLVFDHPRIFDLAGFLTRTLDLENRHSPGKQEIPGEKPPQQNVAIRTTSGNVDPDPADLTRQIQSMSEEQALEELMKEIDQ